MAQAKEATRSQPFFGSSASQALGPWSAGQGAVQANNSPHPAKACSLGLSPPLYNQYI